MPLGPAFPCLWLCHRSWGVALDFIVQEGNCQIHFLGQGLALFYKGPDSKYFWNFRPHNLYPNYSAPPLWPQSTMDNMYTHKCGCVLINIYKNGC